MQTSFSIKMLVSGNIMGAGSATLAYQASQMHSFLHMSLPLWWFFLAVVVLSLFGSLASLLTDTMLTSIRRKTMNFVMGFCFGLLSAFIILPSLSSNPSVGLMMMTALVFSFSGTVLLHNFGKIIRSDEFSDGIHSTANSAGKTIKKRLIAVLKAAVGDHSSHDEIRPIMPATKKSKDEDEV